MVLVYPYLSDPKKPNPITNTYRKVSCDVTIKKGIIGPEYIDKFYCYSNERCYFQSLGIVPCVNCGEGTIILELENFDGRASYWVGWNNENTFTVSACVLERDRPYNAKLKLLTKDGVVISTKNFNYPYEN